MSCLFIILVVVFIYFVLSKLNKNVKEKKEDSTFYCEVEQWGKCREQCERCKKN